MLSNFKGPDLNKPRYKEKVLNLLNAPEIFIDVENFNVELSSGSSTIEEFVIVNTGEAELVFSIDQESYQFLARHY